MNERRNWRGQIRLRSFAVVREMGHKLFIVGRGREGCPQGLCRAGSRGCGGLGP